MNKTNGMFTVCPVCNSEAKRILAFKHHSIFECPKCHHGFSKGTTLNSAAKYDEEYFAQYHKYVCVWCLCLYVCVCCVCICVCVVV